MPNSPTAAAVAAALERKLRDAADPERREHTAGYFPTALDILGVSVPVLRTIARTAARDLRAQPPAFVVAVAHALCDRSTHEGRQAAYELLEARRDTAPLLRTAAIRRLGKGNDNWASVDSFAVSVAGPAWRERRISDTEVLRWAASADPWWRRTALAATVALNTRSRGGSGDTDRTLRVAERLTDDDHPLVIKALSWALRSLVPHDRAAVEHFLATQELPALVRREVGNILRAGNKRGV